MNNMAFIRSCRLLNCRAISYPLPALPSTTVTTAVRVLAAPSRVANFGGPERFNSNYTTGNSNTFPSTRKWRWITASVIAATGLAVYLKSRQNEVAAAAREPGAFIEGLPTYSKDEVAKHKTVEDRVWMTFRHGVYDLTNYIPGHRGGNNIMWGAGRSIDKIWDKFTMHNKKYVYKLLEKYRIGNLTEDEEDTNNHSSAQIKDYKLDLSVDGSNEQVGLTLHQLKSMFPKITVTTTLKCERNKRSDTVATWTGASLVDVLKHSGVDIDTTDSENVHFTGMDKKPDGTPFGTSLPIETVRELRNEIIIAYAMNGADIPQEHGFPVRLIVPRAYANRQVKCLNKITLAKNKI